MRSPRSLLPALVVLVTTLIGAPLAMPAATAASTAASTADTPDPLTVTVESLNPSVIPKSGRVTVTGTVTNTSADTWSGVNLYPITSASSPITSQAELGAAAASDPELVVGERITEISDQIDTLAPGEARRYALRVPRSYLGREEGVYWLVVHALGEGPAGRDTVADGRARTFIPLVEGAKSLPTSIVLQMRRRTSYAADGRLERPDAWTRDLAPGGRLRSVVELGATAGSLPVTWLIDPAVVDAATTLAAGNPGRLDLLPDEAGGEQGRAEDPESDSPEPTEEAVTAAAAAEATTWLGRLQAATAEKPLLALPYGDVDASAASQYDPSLLQGAIAASASAMANLGLQVAAPAISSPNGFLNPAAIQSASPDTVVLGTSRAIGGDAADVPTVADFDGHPLVLASASALEGGPGPDDPLAPVAVRQRILAEAAVRVLTPGRSPLVVTIPYDWNPADANGLLTGLDVGFVDLVPLPEIAQLPTSALTEETPYAYPKFQAEYELDAGDFAAASKLVEAGLTIQQVLTATTGLGAVVAQEAYTDVSYWQRRNPAGARASLRGTKSWIDSILGGVTVEVPPSVTLSSDTGKFPGTLRNDLDQPVLVQVGAASTSGVEVESPEPIVLEANSSTQVRLSATTTDVGTHTVELYVAAADGTAIGPGTALPIRSGQVSRIIWIIMVIGGGLLFGAIAVRLTRRIRGGRAEA